MHYFAVFLDYFSTARNDVKSKSTVSLRTAKQEAIQKVNKIKNLPSTILKKLMGAR